jgi:hypothetical protein
VNKAMRSLKERAAKFAKLHPFQDLGVIAGNAGIKIIGAR